MMTTVYLIPSLLAEDGLSAISPLTLPALHNCEVIFAENARTTRRFIKRLDPAFVIDSKEWFEIHKIEAEQIRELEKKIKERKNIAIVSEAGCPGIADPGALLVAKAHELGCKVKPITGPGAITLALMASGLNGQHFSFIGYLPVDTNERERKLRELEAEAIKTGGTQIFIETPYRNRAVFESILKVCSAGTKLCVAKNLTSETEFIRTATIASWKKAPLELGKAPSVFLIGL